MENEEELGKFFELIYGDDVEGYSYLAYKSANKIQKDTWNQRFFKWPEEKTKLVDTVLKLEERFEVYYGPALYRTKNADKQHFLGSRVCWVDFDGNSERLDNFSTKHSIYVRSSIPGHAHAYWKLDEFVSDIERLECLNRNLAYALGSDFSGWDATQVLRPPGTTNHKRSSRAELEYMGDEIYGIGDFSYLEEAPEPVEAVPLQSLPEYDSVVSKFKFKPDVWLLFKKEHPGDKKRSSALMSLGYSFCVMGMTNSEALVMLLHVDARWKKFSTRTDQVQMLNKIVSVARAKYPFIKNLPVGRLQAMGFSTLLTSKDIELEWIWEGFLQKAGFLLLTGSPKVGKTQFSLDFGQRAILDKSFLGRACRDDLKIGFLSLEMRASELKIFLQAQSKGLSEEQMKELEERFILIPVGEPYYLSRPREQDELEEFIHEHKFDGLIIDSLGSTIEGELTSEQYAKGLVDWSDRMRGRHDCFTWFIHHHRKAQGDNKKPRGLDDIYGSYIFTARVTTALTLWKTPNKSIVEFIPNAVRLAATPEPFQIYRDEETLTFSLKKNDITVVKKTKTEEVEVESNKEFEGKWDF